jgi:murein DD-endopeptidase MepM/ murein hydrolase activator NlpD
LGIKKLTIVLIPEGCTKVKHFRLPKFLVVLFVLFLLPCLAYLSLIIRDYQKIKPQMFRLAQLQRENDLQKRQFVRLVERINQLTQEMGTLQELNHRLRIMVNLEMSEDNTRSYGVGGSDSDPLPPAYSSAQSYRGLVRLMHRSLDTLNLKIAVDRQNKTELQTFFEDQKGLLASTPSIWPTKGWLTSRFGHRLSPFTGDKEFHNGIDVSARRNAPVIAPANGVVSSAGRERLPGRVLFINHGYGLVTKYAHLQKILVKEGQYVKRGEKVALVGSSGRSTGPHLHYEVRLNGVPTNPLNYILN